MSFLSGVHFSYRFHTVHCDQTLKVRPVMVVLVVADTLVVAAAAPNQVVEVEKHGKAGNRHGASVFRHVFALVDGSGTVAACNWLDASMLVSQEHASLVPTFLPVAPCIISQH
jgi:hypothetical protein